MGLHPKPRDLNKVFTDNPLELSTRVIDECAATEPTNRVTNKLSELTDGIAMVESFSHMIAFKTEEGLVLFDASGKQSGVAVVDSLRKWDTSRVHSLAYTHGHLDHVGGSGAIVADAEKRNFVPPTVFGHENVPKRLARYKDTDGWNRIINQRQFGGVSPKHGMGLTDLSPSFVPDDTVWPDVVYQDEMKLSVGNLDIQFNHGKGETDDHTWAWIPQSRTLITGDLVLWVFPNAGNPQKVQRYPLEWAQALREMMTYNAELLLPAHGLPIEGTERINRVLGDLAHVLETLVADTIELMNGGYQLNDILHMVKVSPDMLELPWLQPLYDEPEFVVRNIWRMYGGWWDADPASLKPSPRGDLAEELALLSGGANHMAKRAEKLAEEGNLRLACHLVEFAATADPKSKTIHGIRAEIYRLRRSQESSLMSKGIYAAAMRESEGLAE